MRLPSVIERCSHLKLGWWWCPTAARSRLKSADMLAMAMADADASSEEAVVLKLRAHFVLLLCLQPNPEVHHGTWCAVDMLTCVQTQYIVTIQAAAPA